jgi:hypothetical protein
LVFTNDGHGNFGSNAMIIGGSSSLATGDFNGDGWPDLACNYITSLEVFTNNGHGVFGSNAVYWLPPGGQSPHCIVATDMNNDGYLDLVAATTNPGYVTIYTNNGSGVFALETNKLAGNAIWMVAADVDGDGRQDLLIANYADNNVLVWLNRGNGAFSVSALSGFYYPQCIVAMDVDGDGRLDLIAGNLGKETVLDYQYIDSLDKLS